MSQALKHQGKVQILSLVSSPSREDQYILRCAHTRARSTAHAKRRSQFSKANGSVQDQSAGLTISSAGTVHIADFKKTASSTRVVTPLVSETPLTKPAQKFCKGKPWGCYNQGPQATGAGRGRAPAPRRKGRIQVGRRTAFHQHLIQLRPRCRPTAEREAVPQALRAGYTPAGERRTSASRSALPSTTHLHQTKTPL